MLLKMLYVFLFILVIQMLFFSYAAIKKTDKVTDLSYGLTFVLTSLFLYLYIGGYESIFKTVLLLLVSIWGIRLSGYLYTRIRRIGKDKRFDNIRGYFLKFLSFWFFQAISIYIILLPVIYILLKEVAMSLNTISYMGMTISVLGILIEGIADQQKFVFKSDENNKGKWIQSGLWKYSRHPNYLGEILMWVGVFFFCIIYINDFAIFTVISPIYITILLVGVSGIPTLESEYEQKYAGSIEYERYKRNTGILFPKIFNRA
jgi:steroid 5-alpha reductase family enzyme